MKIVIAIVVIVVLAVGAFIGFAPKFQETLQTSTSSPSPTVSAAISTYPTNAQTEELKQGGSSYLDTQGVWNILYPADYKQDTQNNGQYTRFYKTGKTQTGQTEIYDGVVLTIETISLNGKTLSSFIDERLKQATTDGTSEVVEPKKSVVVNNYPGFTYSLRGLGTFQNTVLQKNTTSPYAISITMLVADPEKQGYQEEVDSILSTLNILK